jgi:hypothetical protein
LINSGIKVRGFFNEKNLELLIKYSFQVAIAL